MISRQPQDELESPAVVQTKRVRRSAEEAAELGHASHMHSRLGRRRQVRTVMSSITRRRSGLPARPSGVLPFQGSTETLARPSCPELSANQRTLTVLVQSITDSN